MRKLFKNSFFSFLQSKVGMILLSIIVFLTAAVFTLLSSVSFSFKKSYNDVMQTNKLHDFTAKEKYNLDGELKFNESNPRQEEVMSEDTSTGKYSQDLNYIYFETKDLTNILDVKMVPDYEAWTRLRAMGISNVPSYQASSAALATQTRNAVIRIPYNALSFIDADGDGVVDNLALTKNAIDFEIASKEYLDRTSNTKHIIPYTDLTTASSILNKVTTDDTIVWKRSDKFRIDSSTNAGQALTTPAAGEAYAFPAKDRYSSAGKLTLSVTAKQGIDLFKEELVKVTAAHGYFHKANQSVVDVTLDKSNSTGIYELLLNPPKGSDPERLKDFQSTEQKIQDYIKVIGLDRPYVISSTGGREQIIAAEAKIREFLKQFAFEQKRSDYLSKVSQLIHSKYGDVLDHKFTESVVISDDTKSYKLVNSIDNSQLINSLHNFEGYNLPSPASDAQMVEELNKAIIREGAHPTKQIDKPVTGLAGMAMQSHTTIPVVNKERGFAYVAHWNVVTEQKANSGLMGILAAGMAGSAGLNHELPHAARVTDPSAFFAAVSPGFYTTHNIKPIDPNVILGNNELREKLNTNPEEVFNMFPNSIVSVGLVKYFVVASAIQPDFAFPIVDAKNPIPNADSQAIVFANTNGYQRGLDSYRNNDKEEYISFRFKDDVKVDRDAVMHDIEVLSRETMTWPSNIQIVSKANDTTEKVILSQQRVAFLEKLNTSIKTITILTSVLLMVFVAFVVMLVVKKQINSKRKMLGILLANGYTKSQISLSMATIALIIAAVPAILGYVVGISIQQGMFSIFHDYWTLPLSAKSFSWEALVLTVVFPTVAIGILASLITRWELKGRLVDILSNSESKTAGFLSTKVLMVFKWMGIKSRISISIFTSNLSKMFLILFSSGLAIVAGATAASMLGKFDYARNQSQAPLKYDFMVNFESPTAEAGLFKFTTPDQLAGDWTQSPDEILNTFFKEPKTAYNDQLVFHLPSNADEIQSHDPRYLDNRIEIQPLLNASMGAQGVASVPWDITKKTMPEGQKILSDKRYTNFMWFGTTLKDNEQFKGTQWFQEIIDAHTNNRNIEKLDGITHEDASHNVTLSNEYKKFFVNTYKTIVNDYDRYKEYMPFIISYRTVMGDVTDERFTSIQGSYSGTNIAGNSELKQLNIIGLKQNSHMIELDGSLWDAIHTYKGNNIPVVVNKYFSEVYGHKVGSTFSMNVTNSPDRFKNGEQNKDVKTFEIVGIQDTYNDAKLYTSQDVANKALGLDKLLEQGENPEDMFNGIFSIEKEPTLFQNLALYSVSGFYPATDTIVQGDSTENQLSQMIDQGKFTQNTNVKTIADYVRTYSRSPYVMVWSNVDWAKMSNYAFDSTLDLSSKIIWLIEAIAIVISILFTAIITTMLIADNKKFIATLKVMGYRRREILNIFYKSLLPSILVGALVAIPMVFALIIGIKVVIIGFGSILIPLHMVGWEIIAATAITVALSLIIYFFSTKSLKDSDMLEAFKE